MFSLPASPNCRKANRRNAPTPPWRTAIDAIAAIDALAVEDRTKAEVLEIGDGLYVHVSDAGLRLPEGVEVVHEEHGTVILAPGDYRVTIQREYSPEAIRNVID